MILTTSFVGRALLCATFHSAAVIGVVTLMPSLAAAQEAPDVETAGEKKRILVGKFSGAKPTSARSWVVEGLGANADYELVSEDDSLALPAGSAEHRVAEFAKKSGADVVILGTSKLGKKGWAADITVYNHDGTVVEKVTVEGGSFTQYEASLKAGAEVAGPLAAAKGWPRPAPDPVAEPEEAPVEEELEEDKPVREAATSERRRPSPFFGRIGGGISSRALRYTGTLNQASETEDYPEPPAYTQDASGAPQVEAHWYPAAHFTDKWFAHLGISGGYQMVLGVNPTTVLRSPDGTQSETVQLSQSQNLWFAGLEGRIPVGSLPLRFLVTARYSQHTFELSGDDQALDDAGELVPAPAASPDFLYQSIEMGGDVEWRPAQLILGGHARYVQVLNAGGVQDADWFPNTSALAVDLGVRAGWAISPVFDLLVGFDSRMYGMDFNPIPDTQPPERIAGGATDRYLGVWLALGVNWPSDEPKSAESGGAAGGADSFDSFD